MAGADGCVPRCRVPKSCLPRTPPVSPAAAHSGRPSGRCPTPGDACGGRGASPHCLQHEPAAAAPARGPRSRETAQAHLCPTRLSPVPKHAGPHLLLWHRIAVGPIWLERSSSVELQPPPWLAPGSRPALQSSVPLSAAPASPLPPGGAGGRGHPGRDLSGGPSPWWPSWVRRCPSLHGQMGPRAFVSLPEDPGRWRHGGWETAVR